MGPVGLEQVLTDLRNHPWLLIVIPLAWGLAGFVIGLAVKE